MRVTLFGCELLETLHEGRRSRIHRGRRPGGAVIVKRPIDPGAPSATRRRLLQYEHDVLRVLSGSEGVIATHGLVIDGDSWGLLLEDFGGVSLRDVASPARPIAERLAIALKLSDAVGDVHGRGVVHRDLNPGNALVNPLDGRLKLIDFSSAEAPLEASGRAPRTIDGDMRLAYVSPEQTGRTRRTIDHRTDYYSLGVVLFELFTGALPFAYDDPLELVHAHMARAPRNPRDLNRELPAALSNVILKLLEKDPDDRYQSMASLRHDLKRCLDVVSQTAPEVDFPLAQGDVFERLRFPERLYGRDEPLEQLRQAFDRSCQGSVNVFCITGPPGIGKSTLVEAAFRNLHESRAYFLRGKFEEHDHATPHTAITQALECLAQHWMAEATETGPKLDVPTSFDFADVGGVLVELCPSFEAMIGQQPRASTLSPREARTRVEQAVVSTFTAAAATGPVCIFLDDMQWARHDSIQLIRELFFGMRQLPVLFVLSWRDADGASRPPPAVAALLLECELPLERVALGSISTPAIAAFLTDTLSTIADRVGPLAEVVFARTAGNPFFVREFVVALHADGLLRAPDAQWDLERIRRRSVTDNVVDLLADRVGRLPRTVRETLAVAACVGGRFDSDLLQAVCGRPVTANLVSAVAEGLLLPLGGSTHADDTGGPRGSERFRFAHDRVQQAILTTLSLRSRQAIHRDVGRRLADPDSRVAHSPRRFEAVKHLNESLALLDDVTERLRLARWNLEAANDAVACSAADSVVFARAGICALGETGWQSEYELERDLHLIGAEAAFAWADHAALDEFCTPVVAHSQSVLDTVRVLKLQGRVHQAQQRGSQAIQTYLSALAKLGITISEHVDDGELERELRATAAAVGDRSTEGLLELPVCTEAIACAAMDLLSKLIFFTFSSVSNLFTLVVCRLLRLSLERGNTADSANGYTFYGLLLSRDGDIERACAFGRAALALAHRFDDPAILSQTYLYVHYQLFHWKIPLAELAGSFRIAHRYGLQAGSPLYAACSATTLCIGRFWAGDELGGVAADMDVYRPIIVRYRQNLVLNWHDILTQLITNLRWEPAEPTELVGPTYDERERLPRHLAVNDRSALFNYHVAKALLCYLFGKHADALVSMEAVLADWPFVVGFFAVPVVYLDSLVRLACCAGATEPTVTRLTASVTENVARLTVWLPHNRSSIEHKIRTLQAELARIGGDADRARALFVEAVELARTSGILHDEAITCELAGRFGVTIADGGMARSYLRSSHRAYLRWGAATKAKALERQHPQVLQSSAFVGLTTRDKQDFDVLDLVSVLSASTAISSEIRLDRLLCRLMSLLIETGGAQTGYLLLKKDGRWVVEAGQDADRGVITVLKSIPTLELEAAGCPPLAASLVNHVARTGQRVSLDDAANSEQFRRDPRIARHRVASLLCFPLKRNGETLAIAYLENNLVRGAFRDNGWKLLEMLSTQALISLEHARLYESLERQVADRTVELREKNAELERALARGQEMQRQLVTQEKLAELGALTAGIAHEIRNPLNFITNFAAVASESARDVAARLVPLLGDGSEATEIGEQLDVMDRAVGKIVEHGARATGIVHGMAMHAGRNAGQFEDADLNAVLAHSVALAAHGPARGGAITIQTDFDPSLPPIPMIVADVSRVFINVLNNARGSLDQKRTHVGDGFVPVISIRTQNGDDRVEIRIRDNGIGVSTEVRDKMFLPFFTTKPSGEGTGLGLSISHDIVMAHGGRLHVESTDGEFAEIVIALPKTRPARAMQGGASRQPPADASPRPTR